MVTEGRQSRAGPRPKSLPPLEPRRAALSRRALPRRALPRPVLPHAVRRHGGVAPGWPITVSFVVSAAIVTAFVAYAHTVAAASALSVEVIPDDSARYTPAILASRQRDRGAGRRARWGRGEAGRSATTGSERRRERAQGGEGWWPRSESIRRAHTAVLRWAVLHEADRHP